MKKYVDINLSDETFKLFQEVKQKDESDNDCVERIMKQEGK